MPYLRDGPQQLNGVAGTGLVLSWITVAARCYVRAIMIKKFGYEDCFSLVSLVLYTIYCAFTFDGAQHGMGKMTIDLQPHEKMQGLRAWWFCGIFYVATTGFLKASIAVQLLNLTDKRRHRIAIQIVLGISVTYTAAFFFILLFECSPVDHFWMGFLGEQGACMSPKMIGALTITHSILNISADWFFAVMPIILVKDLALPPRTKITVSIILAFGGLASCVVIIRLPYIFILEKNAEQLLYYCTWVINCSTAENGLGISAAALATLRPLFRSFLSASKTKSNGQNSESGCLKFVNAIRQRDTAGYVRNREGDLEHGTELSTIQKKILKTEDGTLQVVEDPVLQRSPSQIALRVAPPAWLAHGDKKSPRGLDRRTSNISVEDRVIQKL